MNKLSLRERKKEETRLAIIKSATTLFLLKGYDKTTLSDIAEHANVSQRTIFTYFVSKEAIIFYPEQEIINRISLHLDERGEKTVLESLREFNHNDNDNGSSEAKTSKRRLILENEPLKEYALIILTGIENKLAKEIAEEKGLDADSVQAHIIAAALRAMVEYIMGHDDNPDAAEVAFKFMEAGVQATS